MPSFLSQSANTALLANATSSLTAAVRSGSLTAIVSLLFWRFPYSSYHCNFSQESVIISQGAAQLIESNFSYTATVVAIQQGHLSAVKVLYTNINFPINGQGSTGNTVLIFACEFNQYAIAEYLLQQGADFKLENKRGDTALEVARKKGFTAVANLLLNFGATK